MWREKPRGSVWQARRTEKGEKQVGGGAPPGSCPMGVEWGRPPGGTHSQSATAPRSSATHRYLPIPTKHTAKRRLGRCSQNRSETEPGHVPVQAHCSVCRSADFMERKPEGRQVGFPSLSDLMTGFPAWAEHCTWPKGAREQEIHSGGSEQPEQERTSGEMATVRSSTTKDTTWHGARDRGRPI